MSLELDHVFCFCPPSLPEVSLAEKHGLFLTSGKVHSGQGTANRSILFQENYLEFIYLASEEEAKKNPLQLHRRANWKTSGASPFGIALRGELPATQLPHFWDYSTPYGPNIIKIHEFNESNPEFPLFFVMPPRLVPYQGFNSGKIVNITIETPATQWLEISIEGLVFKHSQRHQMRVVIERAQGSLLELCLPFASG